MATLSTQTTLPTLTAHSPSQVSKDRQAVIHSGPLVDLPLPNCPAPLKLPVSMLTSIQFKDIIDTYYATTPDTYPRYSLLADALKVR